MPSPLQDQLREIVKNNDIKALHALMKTDKDAVLEHMQDDDEFLTTLLEQAIIEDATEVSDYLIDNNCQLHMSIFFEVIKHNRIGTLKKLISQNPDLVRECSEYIKGKFLQWNRSEMLKYLYSQMPELFLEPVDFTALDFSYMIKDHDLKSFFEFLKPEYNFRLSEDRRSDTCNGISPSLIDKQYLAPMSIMYLRFTKLSLFDIVNSEILKKDLISNSVINEDDEAMISKEEIENFVKIMHISIIKLALIEEIYGSLDIVVERLGSIFNNFFDKLLKFRNIINVDNLQNRALFSSNSIFDSENEYINKFALIYDLTIEDAIEIQRYFPNLRKLKDMSEPDICNETFAQTLNGILKEKSQELKDLSRKDNAPILLKTIISSITNEHERSRFD